MFNVSARSAAVEKLRESLKEHETLRKQVEQASVELFEQRQRVVTEVIEPVEEYVNELANTPKEFDKSVRAFASTSIGSVAPCSASRRRPPGPTRSGAASGWLERRPE